MPDRKHINVFGTTFCIPKGKRIVPGGGFVPKDAPVVPGPHGSKMFLVDRAIAMAEKNLEIECQLPDMASMTREQKQKVHETIREDIERLYADMNTFEFTEEQFKEWLAKHPYAQPQKDAK